MCVRAGVYVCVSACVCAGVCVCASGAASLQVKVRDNAKLRQAWRVPGG